MGSPTVATIVSLAYGGSAPCSRTPPPAIKVSRKRGLGSYRDVASRALKQRIRMADDE